MSNPLDNIGNRPDYGLQETIAKVFRAIVERSGGEVVKIRLNRLALNSDIELSAQFFTLFDEGYSIHIILRWNDQCYQVEKFFSIDATESSGDLNYLQAEDVLLLELGDEEAKWQIKSPKSLLALFTAYSRWASLFDKEEVFVLS